MEQCSEVFVGIDVSKMRNAIAVADGERGGEVRYLGEIDAAPESMRRLVKRLAAKHTYPAFRARRWPRWRSARSGPHKKFGVVRHFRQEAAGTPVDCQAIFLSPLADIGRSAHVSPAEFN